MGVRVAVIGSYAVGMTISCDRFPVGGETVVGRSFEKMHGGKGSNQAVAAARMDADVVYATRVGKDEFGDWAMQLYEQEGIDSSNVRRSETGLTTGVGLIYVNSKGENEIVIDFAANREFSPADLDAMVPALKTCKLLLTQLEGSLDTVVHAAAVCHEIGIPFVLNPAPYQKLPEDLLRNCDYLTPNQTEGRQILGLTADAQVTDEEVAVRLHELGVKNVVLTLGRDGAYLVNDTIRERIGCVPVKAVDTTGAGDTFNGAFCVALAEGKDLRDAVRFANAAAGLSVTRYGVIEAVPHRDAVEKVYIKQEIDN